jgi:hypothetical protein
MILWLIVVTTWGLCTNEGRKAAASEGEKSRLPCCVWGGRTEENEGRALLCCSAVAQNAVTALVGISERRNQPTWPLGATRQFRTEKVSVALTRSVRMALRMSSSSLRFLARMELVC